VPNSPNHSQNDDIRISIDSPSGTEMEVFQGILGSFVLGSIFLSFRLDMNDVTERRGD
jgi:hypothetical protein